jgi:hypothetical protein
MNNNRKPVIAVRVPAPLHQRIKDSARASGRSMSEEMAWLLDRAFEQGQTQAMLQKILNQLEERK